MNNTFFSGFRWGLRETTWKYLGYVVFLINVVPFCIKELIYYYLNLTQGFRGVTKQTEEKVWINVIAEQFQANNYVHCVGREREDKSSYRFERERPETVSVQQLPHFKSIVCIFTPFYAQKRPLTIAHRVRVCTQHLIYIQTVLRLISLAKEDDPGNPNFLRSLNRASESWEIMGYM